MAWIFIQPLLFRYAGLKIKLKENKKTPALIVKVFTSLYSFGRKGENAEQLIE